MRFWLTTSLLGGCCLMVMGALAHAETDPFEKSEFTVTTPEGKTETIGYRLLKPEKIEAGKKYPLVLFLHGAGERGNDNQSQLKYLPQWMAEPERRAKFPCFLIAPQCPTNQKWSNVDWSAKTSPPLPDESVPMQGVVGILDKVMKDNPVDPSRVYLTGLSMGGYGSWDLAERMPERFAALVPICGGGALSHADKLVDVPVWAWHGDADNAVPVERSRQIIEAITKAGGHPKYTELPGVGHDSWTPAYKSAELLPWMFEQVRKK